MKRQAAIGMAAIILLCGCGHPEENEVPGSEAGDAFLQEQWQEAASTPYGAYPETVYYTLAKLTGENNSNLPDGDTYENNAYTRLIAEVINVQNRDVYENSGDSYDNGIYMMVKTGEFPDVMIVNEEVMYEMQDQGMLADLTDAFEKCASEKIKDIYQSYGNTIFDNCTFGGRLMAIPETNIGAGPNLCWVRKDYLNAVGLEEPRTLADVEAAAAAFVKANLGGTEAKPNIGLPSCAELCTANGLPEYGLDLIFAAYEAHPGQWVRDENGRLHYGSVEPQVRDALQHLHELYAEGILDKDFLMRTNEDVAELVKSGRCGIFLGPWWAPNNPLWECRELDRAAEWIPCLIDNTGEGLTSFYGQRMNGKYVVVNKNFEHPEVVVKMLSVMFDYMRYDYGDPDEEFEKYYMANVDPTARPLAVNVDYNQALKICYDNLCEALSGKISEEELPLLERSYYQVCKGYMEHQQEATADEWSGYASRIMACALLEEEKFQEHEVAFPRIPAELMGNWTLMKDKEQEVFLKIICGEEPIEAFDAFVTEWMEAGGAELLDLFS